MKAQVIVIVVLGGLAVIAALAYFLVLKGPDLRSYLPLVEPRIRSMPDERVLEVGFSGPADSVIKKAYTLLFKTYYGLKGSPKGPAMKPPKARYRIPAGPTGAERVKDFQNHSWEGSVAIPIPDSFELPPQKSDAEGMVARIASWKYGVVAEILHLGSYDSEPPTIERLEKHVKDSGYTTIGDHEEEYLKGPGMPFVSPKDYWTIIRFRVARQ
jgi:effector-binding domain-containing protein